MPIISLKTGTKSRSLLVGNPYFQPTSYESIASATGTGSSGTITFSSIPAGYAAVQIRLNAICSTADYIRIRVNSDTGSNYSFHALFGEGTSAQAAGGASTTYGWITYEQGVGTTYPAVAIIDIHNYASTTQNKTGRVFGGSDKNGTGVVELNSFLWRSTSAITSIELATFNGNNFTTASTFALYGIK